PGDWPGNLGAGLLPASDGSCQGVFLRYDLSFFHGPEPAAHRSSNTAAFPFRSPRRMAKT
ncbi:hypothetical protein ACWEQU_34030, partial [Streptomyces nodosus]